MTFPSSARTPLSSCRTLEEYRSALARHFDRHPESTRPMPLSYAEFLDLSDAHLALLVAGWDEADQRWAQHVAVEWSRRMSCQVTRQPAIGRSPRGDLVYDARGSEPQGSEPQGSAPCGRPAETMVEVCGYMWPACATCALEIKSAQRLRAAHALGAGLGLAPV